jgi:hypothetical protein
LAALRINDPEAQTIEQQRHHGLRLLFPARMILGRTQAADDDQNGGWCDIDPKTFFVRSPLTAFLSGNDNDAKSIVKGVLSDLGWPNDCKRHLERLMMFANKLKF